MKTLKKISILFLAAVASVSVLSCSGDDSGGGVVVAAEGTITANVGGAGFTSIVQGTTAMKIAVGQAYNITIQGTDLGGRNLQLILNGVDGEPGTYEISDNAGITAIGNYTEVNTTTFATQTWVAPFENSGVAGSITITEISDTNIKGSFEFKARNQENAQDTKQVSGGSFNVNFMQI